MNYTNEQQSIIQHIEETNDNVVILGSAGTGKSTIISYLKNDRTLILSPTSLVADRNKGLTIHKGLNVNIADLYKLDLKYIPTPQLDNITRIVIDEITMVRADLIDTINVILQKAKKNTLQFGGVQMIFLGDLFQLPPVSCLIKENLNRFNKEYDDRYFFSARSFFRFKMFELTKIFRQENIEYKNFLNRLRLNELDYDDYDYINNFVYKKEDYLLFKKNNPLYPYIASTNKEVDSINNFFLQQQKGNMIKLPVFKSVFNKDVKSIWRDVELKEKCPIVITTNYNELKNGAVYEFLEIKNNTLVLKDGNTSKLYYLPKFIRYGYYDKENKINIVNEPYTAEHLASITKYPFYEIQYPAQPSYAITIHKTQGLEFEGIILNPKGMFEHGQLYVGLSRVKNPMNLYLTNYVTPKDIIVDSKVKEFYNTKKTTLFKTI